MITVSKIEMDRVNIYYSKNIYKRQYLITTETVNKK